MTVPQPRDKGDDADVPKRRIFRDDGQVILNARSWCYRPQQWARYYRVNTVKAA